jgi:Domain of unknown function (DUF4286)
MRFFFTFLKIPLIILIRKLAAILLMRWSLKKMLSYEITALVATELIENYEKYMAEKHIPDLLSTGFFCGAIFSRSTVGCYRIQYQVRHQTALDAYLINQAPRLRADFNAHFPTGVEVLRENWEVLQNWKV